MNMCVRVVVGACVWWWVRACGVGCGVLLPQVLLEGDFAFRHGEMGDMMFFVQTGVVQIGIFRTADEGFSTVFATIKPGTCPAAHTMHPPTHCIQYPVSSFQYPVLYPRLHPLSAPHSARVYVSVHVYVCVHV
jgi:hypothetical protein